MFSWLKKLFSSSPSQISSSSFIVSVKCKRCGEIIDVRVRPKEEANPEFGDMDQIIKYELFKDVLGTKCPNLMRLHIEFSPSWSIISKEIENGEIIEIKK
ncbi:MULTISPECIES: hypothetical protein [Dictyoglomus]|jgi:hypothetical protein|uniref:Uncharacterized protein n=1 Tax=Dictyoglomus turgidum (strain DSM 6724 / Z-1310) TaxID=515635 RepID=B8E0R1_DICTD|nr:MULTISPECIES: hypothetical protein [Dictyoglomus]ACK43081.1 conserved hypothetical protein [Dictyoglomus turgidum DSM 6724]PNV79258.1 MAG: hypothetical protein C0196_06345 [Dictyoglomus turgidum]HBU31658.1 hypothetical protein [Dictyoglomus sp.]